MQISYSDQAVVSMQQSSLSQRAIIHVEHETKFSGVSFDVCYHLCIDTSSTLDYSLNALFAHASLTSHDPLDPLRPLLRPLNPRGPPSCLFPSPTR